MIDSYYILIPQTLVQDCSEQFQEKFSELFGEYPTVIIQEINEFVKIPMVMLRTGTFETIMEKNFPDSGDTHLLRSRSYHYDSHELSEYGSSENTVLTYKVKEEA